MILYSFKPLDLGSATEHSGLGITWAVLLPGDQRAKLLSRMGCVVDSVARPARDGSDGCCYLTTAFLAGCIVAVGVKDFHGLQTHLVLFVCYG